jgi:hypothetical protein
VTTPAISHDVRNRLAFWAMAGVALFVAHDAVFFAQIGPGQALVAELRGAGHEYWTAASLVLMAVAIVAGVTTWLRVRHLRERASSLGTAASGDRSLPRRCASAWWRLAILVAHGHAPIAGALIGPEHPLAIPVIGLVTAIAAAMVALVARTQEALVAAIEAALRQTVHAPRAGARPPQRLVSRVESVLARRGAGRAPPAPVFVRAI